MVNLNFQLAFEDCKPMLCLLFSQVTAGFQTTNMLTALPSSFLEPLLSFSLTEDPEVRLLVLQILLSLIDRHDNRPKFSDIRYAGVSAGVHQLHCTGAWVN